MIREVRNAEVKIKHALRTFGGSASFTLILVETQLPYHLAISVAEMLRNRGEIKMEPRPETNNEDFMMSVVKKSRSIFKFLHFFTK